MEFDSPWCPACDRLIQPKRYLVTVPNHPIHPPPKKSGLLNGTGRLRAIKAAQQQQPLKQKMVIDDGPTPLYCSDACHLADGEKPSASVPVKSTKQAASESEASSSASSSSSLQTPPKPRSSIQKFAEAYNMTIPPPPPTFEEPFEMPLPQYTNGAMMAGRLISSLCPTKPARSNSRYQPAPEPRKTWNDGTNDWRSAIYNYTSSASQQPLRAAGMAPTPVRSTHRVRASTSSGPCSPPGPTPLDSDELIAHFNDKFTRRCESRTSLSGSRPATPTSPSSTTSLPAKRERSLLAPAAKGKLLVPDVKLKVRSGSSASLSSATSPLSAGSRKSVRSPLSVRGLDEDRDIIETSFTLRRPTFETRSWSYDNVKTYPIMQLPPKKIKKMETQIIDGKECQVEIEVEVPEVRKRLFLFAPTTIVR